MRFDSTEEEEVQKHYHGYYYEYLRRHFKYLLEKLGSKGDEESFPVRRDYGEKKLHMLSVQTEFNDYQSAVTKWNLQNRKAC